MLAGCTHAPAVELAERLSARSTRADRIDTFSFDGLLFKSSAFSIVICADAKFAG
ncbi:hypothetical protein J7E70_27560 [Variovorax paradoxus]|nr:hypothetical protein [Variovorax paradoxus]